MDAYLLEWLGFLGRWFHLIAGIAWIGSSFYFVWLDSHLRAPRYAQEAKDLGIGGEVWSVHGGGFYRAQKFVVAPPELPEPLHWFKWEAYSTWLSGMFLLGLLYYAGADIYLIDRSVAALSAPAAIGLGLAFIVGGWLVYDALCRSRLGEREGWLAAILLVLSTLLAWGLCQLFSGRGAFIHFGAVLGTIMVANVFFVIIPGQRALVAAKQAGKAPDPVHGLRGKQRSVHNTYFTLPVLFTMISNHYAGFTQHRWNWLLLVLIALAGAVLRLFWVLKHRGQHRPVLVAAGLAALAAAFALAGPRPTAAPTAATAAADFSRVRGVIETHCANCHSTRPRFAGFASPPKNVAFDTVEDIVRHAQAIHHQTVVTRAMPLGNTTGMTEDERALLGRWWRSGAPAR